MEEYLISIIVPMYNCETYIEKCIKSVLNQTINNYELILIDDGSFDTTYAKCISYVTEKNNIYYFHQPNSGVSVARNFGLSKANGDYIVFIDADDFIAPKYVECLLSTIVSEQSDLVVCGYYLYENSKKIESKYTFPENEYICKKSRNEIYKAFVNSYDGIFSVWNKIFKKTLIIENNLEFDANKSHAEDFEFVIKYIGLCENVIFIKECLYYYRVNINSLTRSYNPNQLVYHEDWLRILYTFTPQDILTENKITINITTLREIKSFLINSSNNKHVVKYKEIAKYDITNKLKLKDLLNFSEKLVYMSLKMKTTLFFIFFYSIRKQVIK